MMLVGALTGVWAQITWNSWPLSLALCLMIGSLVGLMHGAFCIYLRTNQAATGLAFVVLCQGVTAFLGRNLVGERVVVDLSCSWPVLSGIPILGRVVFQQDFLVYLAIVITSLVWFFLYKTRWGLTLRAAGDGAQQSAARGIPVRKVRLAASAACGALCGLGGAHLSLAYASQWQESMTSGRGWIALVLVIFSMWRPYYLLFAGFFFGGLTALQLNLQAWGIQTSAYLLGMLPFVLSIVVLVLASLIIRKRPLGMPADLGKPFTPEG
jgi:simple sugar transport system permease protein